MPLRRRLTLFACLLPALGSLTVGSLTLLAPASARAQGAPTWQLGVAYAMDIAMDAPAHRFTGRQTLTLRNGSPDTLRTVYYHLYFNAFQPTSLMAQRNRELPDPDARVVPRIFGLKPDEIGYHRVGSLTQDGAPVTFRVDDTILRADLARPIPPGGQAVFTMAFESQVPLQTRRSGRDSREGIDFSMSQWYPKLANYDARGWHADPYIGREFYAPYGTFDVRITIPAEYMLGATGVLANAAEIGHGYGRDTTRTAPRGDTRPITWRFVAENVHDFAWAADRDYVHDRIAGPNGREYHLLYQPAFAAGWTFLRGFVPRIIAAFEARVGPYVWPQFTVAQAGDGGMEYPMMNFITGGRTPGSLIGVTAHEAAHEWFYGMLGSNEADYSWMDEGFTQWLENEGVAEVFGVPTGQTDATRAIVALQESGLFEKLNQPADWYETNRAYSSAAYNGGSMLLDLLGYVIGDSARDAGLRRYYRENLLRHPQPADVERAMEAAGGVELDWLFHQVANSTYRMDYAVEGVRARGANTEIRLERRDRMVFPVDVKLTMDDGSLRYVTIPTSEMGGAKRTPAGWTAVEPWGWTRERYTLTVPGRVRTVQLDPEQRAPDYNRLNDADRTPVRAAFLAPLAPTHEAYTVSYRPLAVYAERFGPGVGLRAQGGYWLNRFNTRAMLTVYPAAFQPERLQPDDDDAPAAEIRWPHLKRRSAFDGFDYALAHESGVPRISPQTRLALTLDKRLGLLQNRLALAHTFGRFAALGRSRGTLTLAATHFLQPSVRAFSVDGFSVFRGEQVVYGTAAYEAGRGDNRVRLALDLGSSLRNQLGIAFANEFGPIGFETDSRQSATRLTLDAQKTAAVGPLQGRARLAIGLGPNNLAFHRQFRLGAAPFEDVWRSAAARQFSAAWVNAEDQVPFQAFSGVGPVGYAVPVSDPEVPCGIVGPCPPPSRRPGQPAGNTPVGTKMLAGSVAIALPRFTNAALAPFTVEAFSGAGLLWGANTLANDGLAARPSRFALSNVVADAGVGVTFDVGGLARLGRWSAQSDVLRGLKVAAKFPLWLSDPDLVSADEDEFAFRYLFGVQLGF